MMHNYGEEHFVREKVPWREKASSSYDTLAFPYSPIYHPKLLISDKVITDTGCKLTNKVNMANVDKL